MRICIAGKSKLACKSLEYALTNFPNFEYLCLPSKSDPYEDGWQPSFRKLATRLGVSVIDDVSQIYKFDDLLFLSLEFDLIIKPNLFKSKYLFNMHFSLLPKYRGVYTSIFPILHGETSSGVTLHWIDEGIDTGNLVSQRKFEIPDTYTSFDLYCRCIDEACLLIEEELPTLISRVDIPSFRQKGSHSYFSRKDLDLKFIHCSFNNTSENISRFLRSRIFPPYQLPLFKERQIIGVRMTKTNSYLPPGLILNESEYDLEVSTLDKNLILQKATN